MRGKERIASALMAGMIALNGCGEINSPTNVRPTIETTTPAAERQPQWMAELQTYANKELPASLVKKIATEMAYSPEYPTLVASGNLLLDQYENPKKLLSLLPSTEINNPFPMNVRFSDKLGGTTRAFIEIGGDYTAEEITLLSKLNGQALKFMGAKERSTTYDIYLHTYLINVDSSQWSYKLLLAKEASHLLYFRQQMDDIWREVNEKYNVVGGNEMKSIMLQTAYARGNPNLNIPTIGPHFDRALELIDYAGYWHINPDVVKLNLQEKLTEQDRFVLEANIAIANLSVSKSLVVSKSNGELRWREGIGPFSDEWIAVVDQALKR